MLHRPWLAPIVVGFWCVTSGWLLVSKVLPTLQGGAPPGYQALYASGSRLLPVGWTVHWNGTPLGWAVTDSRREPDGAVNVLSRLHFDRLPIEDILPNWAGSLVQRSWRTAKSLPLTSTGRLAIDSAGKLCAFTSTVDLPGSHDGVVLTGTVSDGSVHIEVRVGDLRYEATRHLPDQMMIGDELSPQATLPGLFEGRRWSVPIYSPLRPGRSPLQILHAHVETEENLYWENRLVRVHVVTYREDPSSPREPRCRLWVDRSGRVLKHESAILGSKLEFVRRSDDDAARLVGMLREEAPPADDEPALRPEGDAS